MDPNRGLVDARDGYGGGAHSADVSREPERVKRGSEPRYVVHVDDYQDVPTVRDLARWIERTS